MTTPNTTIATSHMGPPMSFAQLMVALTSPSYDYTHSSQYSHYPRYLPPPYVGYKPQTTVCESAIDCPIMHGLMEWYADVRRPKSLNIVREESNDCYMWWCRRNSLRYLLGYQVSTVGGPVTWFDLSELPTLIVAKNSYMEQPKRYLLSDPDSLTKMENDAVLDYLPHSRGRWHTGRESGLKFRPANWLPVEWRISKL
jgi:hypothetical protein